MATKRDLLNNPTHAISHTHSVLHTGTRCACSLNLTDVSNLNKRTYIKLLGYNYGIWEEERASNRSMGGERVGGGGGGHDKIHNLYTSLGRVISETMMEETKLTTEAWTQSIRNSLLSRLFTLARQPRAPGGQRFFIHEVSRSHTKTNHSR